MKKTIKLIIVISLVFTLFSASCSISEAAEVADSTDALSGDSLFTKLFDKATSHATEIFCALTLMGSLILAYAYKKGLVPLLKKALLSIGTSVNKIKEKAESGEIAAEKLSKELTEKLGITDALVKNLEARINQMCIALDDVRESEKSKEDHTKSLTVIVSAQIDMLYDIFMSSAIPQYQKDAVGERVAKMKEALGKDVTN